MGIAPRQTHTMKKTTLRFILTFLSFFLCSSAFSQSDPAIVSGPFPCALSPVITLATLAKSSPTPNPYRWRFTFALPSPALFQSRDNRPRRIELQFPCALHGGLGERKGWG